MRPSCSLRPWVLLPDLWPCLSPGEEAMAGLVPGSGVPCWGHQTRLASAWGCRAQVWGLLVPKGSWCGLVGMGVRGDLKGVLYLSVPGTVVGSLWCRVWPEAGKSALHQAHSRERAGGKGQLFAGGRPHPEGTGAHGAHGTSRGAPPLRVACPCLVPPQGTSQERASLSCLQRMAAWLEAALSGARTLPCPPSRHQGPHAGSRGPAPRNAGAAG